MRRYRHVDPKRSDALNAWMIKHYEAGASIRELARYLDMGYSSVRRRLHSTEVEVRGRGGDRAEVRANPYRFPAGPRAGWRW